MARVLTCPRCYQRVNLDDVVVTTEVTARAVATCGRIVVRRKGRLSVREASASAGIEVEGAMQAESARTAGHLYLGPGATWRGDCAAATLVMHPGARVADGRFQIAPIGDRHGPSDAAAGAAAAPRPAER
jgi:hypothetical protein